MTDQRAATSPLDLAANAYRAANAAVMAEVQEATERMQLVHIADLPSWPRFKAAEDALIRTVLRGSDRSEPRPDVELSAPRNAQET